MTAEHDPLVERLADGDYVTVRAAIVDAITGGERGEQAIINRIRNGPRRDLPLVIAALGDCTGPSGTALLKELASQDAADEDLRCAALVSLAKRAGSDASAILATALSSRRSAVKDYAIAGLAAVGDDRVWNEVLERLKKILGRESRDYVAVPPTDVQYGAVYLGRHLETDATRSSRVVRLMHRRWHVLHRSERSWFDEFWPQCDPEGVALEAESTDLPDSRRLSEWARSNFLRPAFISREHN